MKEVLELFIIGIALSMDTFSVSLSIGTIEMKNKIKILISSIVGIMHFFMPILGLFLGNQIMKIIDINTHLIIGIIFILLSMEMIFDLFHKDKKSLILSFIGIISFAFGVSLDSFTTGIGLKAITSNVILASSIFAFCSSVITYLGLLTGKFLKNKIGIYSNIFGALILLILGISYLHP